MDKENSFASSLPHELRSSKSDHGVGMRIVNIHDAKTNFSKLIDAVGRARKLSSLRQAGLRSGLFLFNLHDESASPVH